MSATKPASLEAAIAQEISLGHADPVEIARRIERRHGKEWVAEQLSAHRSELVAEIARQTLGRQRRALALPAVIARSDVQQRGEVMLAKIYIPGFGWKALGDCTRDDLRARERWYLQAAGTLVRWATWCHDLGDLLEREGVDCVAELDGPLPELPEAEAVA